MLGDILPDHRVDLFHLLMSRIEALEIQNYNLISIHEQYVNQLKGYIDDLGENLDTMIDIQMVLNQVYEAQAITKKFLAIRDTLNERDDFISKQKDFYRREKEKLDTSTLYNQNLDVLLCKDKFVELKQKPSAVKGDGDIDILLHDNYIVKTNNIRLRNILLNLLRDNNISNAPIDELNYLINSNCDVILSGDLLYMLNSQAKLIEDSLFK
jgi:hypothetical protein